MTRSIEGPSWIVGSPESIERKGGRRTLPRTTDAVDDAVRMMHGCNRSKGETAEWFILDLTDWFFNVPLHPKEHKHFTLAFQGIYVYVAHLTQAQGSANAPFVCGRVAALIACLMQGVFGDGFYRLQLYVDDPCICIAGDEKQRSHIAATILLWATLGIRLAYRKASSGTDVTWIGCTLPMHKQNTLNTPNAQVIVRAKQDIV